MATETIVTLVCDMPHAVSDTENEGDAVATFELYSKGTGRYEVDLCRVCAARMFAPAVLNGRKVPTRKK